MRRHLPDRLALTLLAAVTTTACAAKAPVRSFADVPSRVRPNQTMCVVDGANAAARGRVVDVSATAITLDVDGAPWRRDAAAITAIDRCGDPIWNGLAIGAGVGTALVLLSDPQYESCPGNPGTRCSDAHVWQRIAAVGVMAAAGAGIDALITRREPVYRASAPRAAWRITVSPAVGASSAGLVVTIAVP